MTHINAFYTDVEEAKAELALAQGRLAQAETALKSHPDFVQEEKAEKPVEKKQTKSKL